jgi:peroxiredoxin
MAATLKAGDHIPTDASFLTLVDGAPTPITYDQIFANKKVALFAVPGAFTPGCSKTHCPSFVLGAAKLKQKGIDAVYCTATNDCFVMDAWAESQNAKGKITFLADGNGDFARKVGLTKETGPFGGTRSARYALIATNGVVDYIAVDDQGVDKTTADSLLAHL